MANNLPSVPNDKFLPAKKEEINTDLDYSRKNLYQLIETAMGGIEDYIPIAQQSQNARAYEVLFNAIKTAAELNEKLADHSIKKEDVVSAEKSVSENGDTINQNLFVTAADLQELLKKASKDEDI